MVPMITRLLKVVSVQRSKRDVSHYKKKQRAKFAIAHFHKYKGFLAKMFVYVLFLCCAMFFIRQKGKNTPSAAMRELVGNLLG